MFLEQGLPKRLYPVIASLTGQGTTSPRLPLPRRDRVGLLRLEQPPDLAEGAAADLPRRPDRRRPRASGGIYGALRVTAELRFGREIIVGHNAVASIMRELGIKGLPTRRLPKGARVARVRRPISCAAQFRRDAPDELWMTDITEHPTREGKVYCCVVLDAFSRLVVGWSIDTPRPRCS